MKRLLFFFILTASLLITNVVFAAKPTLPPSWFQVQVEFDTTDLPPGVSIIKKEDATLGHHFHRWFISNKSGTPLYLLQKKNHSYDNVNYFTESKISSDYVPIYKLVSNEVYYVRRVLDLSGRQAELDKLTVNCDKNGCYSCDPKKFCDPSVIEINYDLGMYNINDLDIRPTKNIYQTDQDNRPLIPEPEEFKLLVYYGDKPIVIKGKFVYFSKTRHETER